MAEGPQYGASAGDWRDAIRRTQEMGRSNDELRQKEQQRQSVEETGQGVDRQSTTQRESLSQATATLTGRLLANTGAIEGETVALQANIAVMREAVALRREMAGIPVGAGGQAAAARVGAGATAASGAEVEMAQIQARNAADMRARAEADLARARQAEAVIASRGSLALPPARYTEAGPVGSTGAGYLPGGQRPIGPRGIPLYGVTTGGPSETVSLAGRSEEEATKLAALRTEATNNAEALSRMGTAQGEVNRQMAAANAVFADNSTMLSRHGALTTEFIQSLARGEVTLGEFGSQVTSVIGKFGGWAIAGAAVYGVYDALKHVYDGARDTQGAVQQLGRFLPGLGGPAGGGTGQIGAAETTVRNISTQFNVPISEVSDAMQVMARTFHSVSDAGQATRAALAAYRLDQVPLTQSEQYLVGIANTMGYTQGGQVVNVVNQLNALQAQYGVRVAQSLPGLARAVPSALASGIELPNLEALVGLGVRSGVTGNQIGTALVRSMTNFAFRPGSATIFGQYGITPKMGQYGDLMDQVMGTIDSKARNGTLTGTTLRNLATALGGPQLGGRSILPILEQEALRPGAYARMTATAEHPRPYQEDLDRVLGSVSERFKSIGIGLSAFGSEMASITLTPIIGLLDVAQTLMHVFEAMVAPLSVAGHVFEALPAPMRDLLGILVAMRVGRAIANTPWAGAGASLIGRLPGLDFLRSDPRDAVFGARATLQREILPAERADAEMASRRYRQAAVARQRAAQAVQELEQSTPLEVRQGPLDNPATAQYQRATTAAQERLATTTERAAAAEAQYAEAAQQVANTQGLINTLKDRQLSFAQRAALLEEEGWYTLGPTANLAQEATVAYTARARGGAVSTAEAGAASAAGIGAMTAASMRAAAQNQSGIDDIVQSVGQSQAMRATMDQQAAERSGRPVASFADLGWAARDRITMAQRQVMDRLSLPESMVGFGGMGMVDTVAGLPGRAGEAAKGIMGSPMAPFVGLLAAQMIGQAVGGSNAFGATLSGGVTTGLTGMMMMQMLGKGPMGMGLGYLAGSVLGSAQQGAGAGIGAGAGALVGGVLGGALGTLTDLFTFGMGTVVGAGLGSTVGGFVGNLIGGPSTPPQVSLQDHASRAVRTAQRAVDQARNLDPRGGFLSQFTNALTLGGSAGSNAQTQASAQLQQLNAEMLVFGPTSSQGRQASALATSAILSTLANARSNPAAAQQILQAADQARQGAITNQLKYSLQTGPAGSEFAAADTARQSFQAEMAPYQNAVSQAAQGVTDAQAELNQALKGHNQKLISQQRQALTDAQAQLSAVKGIAKQEEQTRDLNIQQAYQQAYQYTTQRAQAQGNLAVAQAGGNVIGQARAQESTAQQLIDAANRLAPYDPHTAAVDKANARAQLLQAQQRIATQGLTELQSRGAVAEASVFTGDPIAQARVNLQNLRDQYHYMKDHSKAFDPSQVKQGLAAVIAAEQQFAQTISDYNTQMIGLRGQIAQAEEYGNVVAQAATGLRTGYLELAAARTPAQRAQAQLNVAQAISQGFQAQQQTITAQGQLSQAQASGDPVQQAALAISSAQALLRTAHGIDNVRSAETQLAQANYAYQQALEQRQVDLGNLAASTTIDPVQQLRDQVAGIARALAIATRPQDRIQLQTQLNTTRHQMEATLIDTREQTINFHYQMMQISSQQAINQLEGLLHLQGLTRAKRQEILQQIRQYQLGLVSPIGASGQFDLAPGNIRLPTFYDVAHALRGGRPAANATAMAVNSATQINVYVHRAHDVPKVAEAIDRATSSNLRQRLRAAGVR